MNSILVKDNNKLPDFYSVTITFLTGKKETFEVVSNQYIEKMINQNQQVIAEHFDTYVLWTKDDEMIEIPRASIESIKYDKNWSTLVHERNKPNKG
jgi:hypothetical protein